MAARRERGEPSHREATLRPLPALDQVTGWSKADPTKKPREPGRALFGARRIEDMKGK